MSQFAAELVAAGGDKAKQAAAVLKQVKTGLPDEELAKAATLGLTLCKESGDKKGQAAMKEAILAAGVAGKKLQVAEELLGKGLEEALKAAKEVASLGAALEDKNVESSGLTALAKALTMTSRTSEALVAATQALGLGGGENKATACVEAARASIALKYPTAAVERATEAVSLFKGAKSKKGEATALTVLAEACALQKDADGATKAAADAVAIFKDLDDKPGQACALCAVASAQSARDDNESALKSAREALLLAHQAGDRNGEALAKAACARLRPKADRMAPPTKGTEPPLKVVKPSSTCVPGVSGPMGCPAAPFVGAKRIVGSAEHKTLSGMVCMITGASRGIGKGISSMLAEAGAVVYVTGRSSPGKVTDILLMGTVDETAAGFSRLGGVGVATHVDHAQDTQNKALAQLITNNHGRLDVLVNNAFYIPKPDMIFFGTPIWMQPIRFLNEQTAVGGFNHAAQTLLFLPCLRRGKGVVINVSSWGSQVNIPVFPVSYLCNKAAFDRSVAALSNTLRRYEVHIVTLWPGSVKSERSIMGAKRSGAKLIDLETTRFSGHAVVNIAKMQPLELRYLSNHCRTISSADMQDFEVDGYMHESNMHSYHTAGSAFLR